MEIGARSVPLMGLLLGPASVTLSISMTNWKGSNWLL